MGWGKFIGTAGLFGAYEKYELCDIMEIQIVPIKKVME